MYRPACRLLILGVALPIAACSRRPPDPVLRAHMDEHFLAAVDLQTAVIRGELEEARDRAAWLADHPVPAGLTDADLQGVRVAARDAAQAVNLAAAAQATARLGLACGACHDRTGGGPELFDGLPPSRNAESVSPMFWHIWSVDRMWEGLIARSDNAWETGAVTLLRSLVPARVLVDDVDRAPQLQVMLDNLATLGTQAADAHAWEERGALFGELLVTCAGCHTLAGVRPLGEFF